LNEESYSAKVDWTYWIKETKKCFLRWFRTNQDKELSGSKSIVEINDNFDKNEEYDDVDICIGFNRYYDWNLQQTKNWMDIGNSRETDFPNQTKKSNKLLIKNIIRNYKKSGYSCHALAALILIKSFAWLWNTRICSLMLLSKHIFFKKRMSAGEFTRLI